MSVSGMSGYLSKLIKGAVLSLSQNEAYSVNEAYSGEKNTQIWVNINFISKVIKDEFTRA